MWDGGEGIAEVEVNECVVRVGMVMVFNIFVQSVWAVFCSYAKLVWRKCLREIVFGIGGVHFSCQSA